MDSKQTIFFHRMPEPEQSVLYIVGTPIGNLNDIKDLCKYKIDALALSRVLHYNLHSITEIKRSINSIS